LNYIIDGFNLAFKITNIAPKLRKGQIDLAIKQLTQFVKSRIKNSKSKIIIVFDGRDNHGQSVTQLAGIKLLFSRKPQTADDIIRDFIRKTQNIEKWYVVSSDNEIIFTAQDHGAKAMKSDDFLKQTFTAKKNKNPISHEKSNPENIDVEYWRKLFEAGKKE
jgi:predicted RNA-binding protein with PIN domain